MSGLMNKVKDALSGDKHTSEAAAANQGNNEYGHGHSTPGTGIVASSTTGNDSTGYGSHGTSSTTAGPHSSNLGNKADPRVDSDLDGNRHGHGTTGSGLTGSHNTSTTGTGYGSSNTGPHSSSLANKADPRVDSDLDGRRGIETSGTSGGYGSGLTGSHNTGTTSSGLTGSHNTSTTGTGYGSSNTGPHSSSLANKADPRVDSDLDGRRGVETSNKTGGYGSGTTGSGLTGSHNTSTTGTGYGSSNTGPHSSSLANKADPRVDSDLDGRRGVETSNKTGGYGSGTTGSGLTGSNTTGTGYGSSQYGSTAGGLGSHSTTAGPHSSNLANKADPRVDSDLDGRSGMGSTNTTGTSGTTGSGLGSSTGHHGHHGGIAGKVEDIVHGGAHHTETANRLDPHVSGGRGPLEHATVEGAGSGLTGSHGVTGHQSSTAGPHSSNLANKADPRVDSDLDGRSGIGSSTGTTGGLGSSSGTYGTTGGLGSSTGTHGTTSGYGSSNTTAGPHSSNLANKADPRVDSDLDGSRGYGSSTGTTGGIGSSTGTHGTSSGYGSSTGTHGTSSGYGSSNTTAGPHSSNLGNKADPRVDSDLDGRSGMGSSTGTTGGLGSNTGTHGSTSGYGSSTGTHGSHTGTGYNDTTSSTGTGSTTAGPHKSNLLNKLDPRVDSNQDGSRMK
ncbi:MAG: hypothetical protein LQ352_007411 [Teloschistes flavicans]|nr:MAG: hypothetical protein LQ352_007411 [Teloschistes flavicans]